jgi:protein TonB
MKASAAIHPVPFMPGSELIKNYQKFLRRGFEYAILAHIVVLSAYLLGSWWAKQREESQTKNQQRIINVTLTDLQPPPSATEEEPPPPPKVEEMISQPPKDLSALTPEPVAKEKAELQTIKTQEELEKIKTPVSTTGDSGTFAYSGPIKVEEKKIEEKIEKERSIVEPEKTVFQFFEVEQPPECVNLSQVRNSMVYPEVARQAGIEGRVTVKVLVGPDGSVIKVGSLSGPEVFHDEVRGKVGMLQFTPGLQNGKPVKVWVTVPFNFKLSN